MDPRALEAVLRDPRATLEGASFLGRVLGAEIDRDPFGVTHETLSASGEPVHVRILLPDPQPGELNRLGRNARVAAKGKPPALPPASSFGTLAGLAYFDFRPTKAVLLAERLHVQGRLEARETITLVAALARSLGEVHLRGGSPGAIRPTAVLLGPHGIELAHPSYSGWSPWRIALASAMAEGDAKDSALDALASAAPEQLAARDAESARGVAASNDVYALGVLLFTMLTGRTPYARATAAQTIDAVLRGAPERPRKHAPDMPRGVEEVILHCLAKNAGHRPRSALVLAEMLLKPESARTGIPETSDAALIALERASDASGVAPPPAPSRATPWPLLIALVVFSIVALGIALAFAQQRRHAYDAEIARGDEALEKGDAEIALAAFERAKGISPSGAGLKERLEKATTACDQQKRHAEAKAALSKAILALPRSDTRLQLLEQAVTLDPTLIEAHRERARFLVARAQDEPSGTDGRKQAVVKARAAVDALLAAGGKSADDHLQDAKVLALDRRDATGALEKAVAAEPRSVAGSQASAQLHLRRHELQEAQAAIERALQMQPFDARLLLIRAKVRRGLGESDRARTDLDAAIAADPEDRVVRAAVLDAAIEARDLGRAKRMLDERPIESDRDPDLIGARAYLLLMEGKRDQAAEHAGRALDMDASCVRAKVVRGRLALLKNDLATARRDLEARDKDAPMDSIVASRALEGGDLAFVPHDRADVLIDVGAALDHEAERTRAKRVLDRAVMLAPEDQRARLLRGQVLAGLQDYDRAIIDADAVVQRRPDNIAGHALRARIYEGQGRTEQALGEWTTLVGLAPSHTEFRALRGFCLFELKKYDEAREDLELYMDTQPRGTFSERAKNTLDKIKK